MCIVFVVQSGPVLMSVLIGVSLEINPRHKDPEFAHLAVLSAAHHMQ